MNIVAIIVTHNNEAEIESCLKSLHTQVSKIVIVDSYSQDKTVPLIKNKYKKLSLIEVSKNIGFAVGNNIGISKAISSNPDHFLMLNPDTEIDSQSIKKLLFQAETHIQEQILGPLIYKDVGKQTVWSAGGVLDKKRYTAKLIGFDEKNVGQFDEVKPVEFISGTCMLIPRKVFETGLRLY